MKGPYLKPADAARLLRISPSTMKRRIRDGSLPVLVLGPNLRRVEACAVTVNAPSAAEPPSVMNARELAIWFDIHPATVLGLARDGVLPGLMVGGHLVIRRRALLSFVIDHTIGDEGLSDAE